MDDNGISTDESLEENYCRNFKYIIDNIVGNDYYNYSYDVYTANDLSAKDIVYKYKTVVNKLHVRTLALKISCVLFVIIDIILFCKIIFN